MSDSVGSGFPSTGINRGHLFYDVDDNSLWVYLNGPAALVSSWKLLNGNLASQPDTSLWGMLQAGASWTFNGVYYGWDGTQIIQITNGAPVSLYNYKDGLLLQDDFITGTGGVLGFTTSGGTTTVIASEVNRPGILRRDTSAVGSTIAQIRLHGGSSSGFDPSTLWDLMWIVRANNFDADTAIRFGAVNAIATSPPANGVYVEKLFADTNWFFVVRAATVETRVDSGILISAQFVKFKINRRVGDVQFIVNDVLVATLPLTNMPTAFLNPEVLITNNAAAAKTIDIDYFEFNIRGVTR